MNRKLLMAVLVLIISSSLLASESELRPWVFFDLGNTLVDTSDRNNLDYFPGTLEYLTELQDRGLKLGLITNIPETWGENYQQKLTTLKKYLADRWQGDTPFKWEMFEQIILPLSDTERKPKPFLFQKALSQTPPCPLAFISESSNEIVVAKNVGLSTFLVKNSFTNRYIPQENLLEYLKNTFQLPYNEACFDHVRF